MSTFKDKRGNPGDVIDVFVEGDPLKNIQKPSAAATTHLYRNSYFKKQVESKLAIPAANPTNPADPKPAGPKSGGPKSGS